jgi:hypothetical protein
MATWWINYATYVQHSTFFAMTEVHLWWNCKIIRYMYYWVINNAQHDKHGLTCTKYLLISFFVLKTMGYLKIPRIYQSYKIILSVGPMNLKPMVGVTVLLPLLQLGNLHNHSAMTVHIDKLPDCTHTRIVLNSVLFNQSCSVWQQ